MLGGTEYKDSIEREDRQNEHKIFFNHPSNNVSVYTDGSGIDNHVRAAAVAPLTERTKMAYMGSSEVQLSTSQSYRALGWPFN